MTEFEVRILASLLEFGATNERSWGSRGHKEASKQASSEVVVGQPIINQFHKPSSVYLLQSTCTPCDLENHPFSAKKRLLGVDSSSISTPSTRLRSSSRQVKPIV
jgi:hypothetical protein